MNFSFSTTRIHPFGLLLQTISALVFIGLSANGFAQERYTVKDPGVTFSYELPADWSPVDTDFYHYIRKDTGSVVGPEVSITYFEGKCQDLDECFDGEVNGGLPFQYENFEKLAQGEEVIDGERAKWVRFSGSAITAEIEPVLISYIYYTIRHGQLFVLQSRAIPSDPSEAVILDIIRSFRSDRK